MCCVSGGDIYNSAFGGCVVGLKRCGSIKKCVVKSIKKVLGREYS